MSEHGGDDRKGEEEPRADSADRADGGDSGEGNSGDAKRPTEPLTYSRFAAVAMPPLVVAVIYLVYQDIDRVRHEPPQPPIKTTTTAVSRPVVPPSPATAPPAAAPSSITPTPVVSNVFESIYRDAFWGHNAEDAGHSGTGSTLEATVLYRAYLQSFLKTYKIKSVVDAGCGDWEFSKAIDWSGIDYKGYDIVDAVITKNKAQHASANIHFFTANIVTDDLPAADLLISKHVMQHLPTADVMQFLSRHVTKYQHLLLTNGVDSQTFSSINPDTGVGGSRFLDPTQPPFGLPGKKVLTWWDGHHMQQVVHSARK